MHSAQPIGSPLEPDLEESAMGLLSSELDDFVQISMSMAKSFGFLQTRVKSIFPKDCRKCGRVYESFEDFYFGTDEIAHGTVCYPSLGEEFYLHRNCRTPCESTLVVVFTDRRDDTAMGFKRRGKFQECIDKLQKLAPTIQSGAAREFLFALLSKRIHQVQKLKQKDQALQLVDDKKSISARSDDELFARSSLAKKIKRPK